MSSVPMQRYIAVDLRLRSGFAKSRAREDRLGFCAHEILHKRNRIRSAFAGYRSRVTDGLMG